MTKAARPLAARSTAGRVLGWLPAAVLFVASASTLTVRAQMPDHPGMGMPEHGMMMWGGPGEHLGRRLDHMLDGLHATAAQRAQIQQIAQSAEVDLRAQHDQAAEFRHRAVQLFAAPLVDAAAVEALRQQMVAQHDQASKRVVQAMLDISKVLTPEQRAKFGARMDERDAIMKERMERMERMEHMHHEHPAQ